MGVAPGCEEEVGEQHPSSGKARGSTMPTARRGPGRSPLVPGETTNQGLGTGSMRSGKGVQEARDRE